MRKMSTSIIWNGDFHCFNGDNGGMGRSESEILPVKYDQNDKKKNLYLIQKQVTFEIQNQTFECTGCFKKLSPPPEPKYACDHWAKR